MDSTGLQLFGQGEWDAEKHGRAKRKWLKLHLAINADTGEIDAHVLTDGTADDAAQTSDLLGQAGGTIASVTADGAYDGEPTYAAAAARQPDAPPEMVVPPRTSAVPTTADPVKQTPRDRHIRFMAEKGRLQPASRVVPPRGRKRRRGRRRRGMAADPSARLPSADTST